MLLFAKTWARAEFSFLARAAKQKRQHESKDLVRAGMNLDAVQDAKPNIWAMICHRVVANKTCKLGLKNKGGKIWPPSEYRCIQEFKSFLCHGWGF